MIRTNIYWIEDFPNLGIMPRPRSGEWLEDEILALKDDKVSIFCSLLTEDEITELGLTQEQNYCKEYGIEHIQFPIADRSVPKLDNNTISFIYQLSEKLKTGQRIVIHCRMGGGRSALIAACIMVLSGISLEDAFKKIEHSRGFSVPDTEEQANWVVDFITEYHHSEFYKH
ncbi:MAG: dual specificity protein phosphatase family protein [Blastocatellia bacterium]|nr:dual specificity protein phosphatase family protein [Blastocatellia bacterium]